MYTVYLSCRKLWDRRAWGLMNLMLAIYTHRSEVIPRSPHFHVQDCSINHTTASTDVMILISSVAHLTEAPVCVRSGLGVKV